MDILIKALQLVLALVILVTVHEFGHYIFARIFGVKVNRFYLFFNPWFSLLRYDPMKGTVDLFARNGEKGAITLRAGKPREPRPDGKTTWRDTIYGLGWVPLGGYCDIAGMVDETKSASDLASEPQHWELRAKPAWQRLCVMVAGVTLNFVLAIIIYIGIAFHWGDDVIPYQAMTEGMDFSPELQDAGFRNGDILLALNGEPLDATDYSLAWDMMQPGARVDVLRDGDTATVVISETLLRTVATKGKDYMPMAARNTVPTITEFLPSLQAHAGQTVPMRLLHADGSSSLTDITVSEAGKIGIQMLSPLEIFDRQTIHYNIFQSVPRGWEIGTDRLASYVSSLKLVFTKEGAQSIGGFGTLGDLFPTQWNWYTFWQITAFLSIILAFMNIIPIPGLDGGYTLFLLVEIVTGRKPSDRFLEVANMCGFAFLLLLLVYANGNDIYRFFIK